MGLKNTKNLHSYSRWVIATALLLCLFFGAIVFLKSYNDVLSYKKQIDYDLSLSSKSVGNLIDRDFLVARSYLKSLNNNDINQVAGGLISLPQVKDVSIFNTQGLPTTNTTASGNVLSALTYAAASAGSDTWFGTIAINKNYYLPAISLKAANGETLAATLAIPSDLENSNNLILISDAYGHIIYSSKALKFDGIGEIKQAFHTQSLSDTKNNIITARNNENYIIANSSNISNFNIYSLKPYSVYSDYIIKTLSYCAIIIMGLIVGFIALLTLIRNQNARIKFARLENRKAQRRLKLSENATLSGGWEWVLHNDEIYLSAKAAQFCGLNSGGNYKIDELIPLINAKERRKLIAAINNAIKNCGFDVTIEMSMANGAYSGKKTDIKYINIKGYCLKPKDKNKKLKISGVAIDKSELVSINQKAQTTEKRIINITESFPGPLAFWNEYGRLILCNKAFMECFNFDDISKIIGQKYSFIIQLISKNISPESFSPINKKNREIILNDGKWLKIFERKLSEGGLVSIAYDITPQKELQATLIKSKKILKINDKELERTKKESRILAKQYEIQKNRADEALNAKSSFLANMSHELRTPLNAINGFSQMMADELYGQLGDKRYKEYSKSILASGRHLLELINDILDMAKIEAGNFTIDPRNISLTETINQAVRMLIMRAEEKNIIIETDITDEIDEIYADPRAIRQIILNLLSNSIKYTKNDGRILIRTRVEGDNIIISVIDTGVGISEEDLPRLGYAFEQVEKDHSKASQGTGLGLALCRAFAEMHGGKLEISSKLGVGTKVNISIPKLSKKLYEAA